MSKSKKPNRKLQHERELRGWSQQKVAEEIGTDEKRIGVWERGESTPSPYFRQKLIELFGKNAQELGFLDNETFDDNGIDQGEPVDEGSQPSDITPQEMNPFQPIQLLIPAGASVYITTQLHERTPPTSFSGGGAFVLVDGQPRTTAYSSHENDVQDGLSGKPGQDAVDRRDFFRVTGRVAVTGAAFLASHDMLGAELLDRLYRALEKPSTVDGRMLTYLERRTGEYWQDRHSATLASSDLLGYVLDHFQKVTQLLEGPLLPTQRVQLCAIASKTALLVGELFIDMSYYSRARQYDEIAIRAAQESSNRALEAVTRGRMSLAWTYSKNIPAALTNVQEARYLAKENTDLTVCSWLAAIEAEAQANLHNRQACLNALDDAERVENQPGTGEDSYLIHFDRALLRGYQGVCYRQLYDPDDKQSAVYLGKAQSVLIDSLTLLDPTLIQRQPTFLTDLAETYLQQEEIEEACERATQATIGATQIKLQKVVLRLQKLRGELEPWKDTPYVKRFDGQLAALRP